MISNPVKKRSAPLVDLRIHCEMHTTRNRTTASVPWVNAPLLVNLRILLLTQEELRLPLLEMPTDSQGMEQGPPPSPSPEVISTCLHLNASSPLTNFRSNHRSRYATIVVRLSLACNPPSPIDFKTCSRSVVLEVGL